MQLTITLLQLNQEFILAMKAKFGLPTITHQKISPVICNSKVVFKKRKTTISSSGTPLFHFTRYLFQSTEKRNKHISI